LFERFCNSSQLPALIHCISLNKLAILVAFPSAKLELFDLSAAIFANKLDFSI